MIKSLLLFTTCWFFISCSHQTINPTNEQLAVELDDYIQKAKEIYNIPGLAIAVVKNNQTVYKKYLGYAHLESNKQVNENSLFRIFSATKLITTVAVFDLMERSKLGLNDTIGTYLEYIPEKWKSVKVINLLSHSSGLPDLISFDNEMNDEELLENLYKLPLEFPAGRQFSYNQTNYWLLARIIEKVSQKKFENFVLENQFNQEPGVTFSSNANQIIPGRATRYHYNPKNQIFDKDTNNNGSRGHSGNGLNITLNQFIKWNQKLENNQIIKNSSKTLMWSNFDFASDDKFLLGWDSYPVNGLNSVGFSGGNLAAFRKFIDDDLTIIFLSNGYQTPVYDIIVNDIARITHNKLKQEELTLESHVMTAFLRAEYETAKVSYKKLMQENTLNEFSNLRLNINSIGNLLQFLENNTTAALNVFKINAELNPNWWIALASLAEIHESMQNYDAAIHLFNDAIKINIKNEYNYNSLMMKKLKGLQARQSDVKK